MQTSAYLFDSYVYVQIKLPGKHTVNLFYAHAVETFQNLLELEAKYGPPPQHTAAIKQIINYYKQV